jgi:serine/threonine protein kinase
VTLYEAFEDTSFLYLVMNYFGGGDLMTYLIRLDMFDHDTACFYSAELILAIEYVHKKLNCMHRDLKPDNIALTLKGHLVLLDFGLAVQHVSYLIIVVRTVGAACKLFNNNCLIRSLISNLA